MIVYKYRGGNDDTFERDVRALVNNYYWAPNYSSLNDPCETIVLTNGTEVQLLNLTSWLPDSSDRISGVMRALREYLESREKCGIYSLSRTYDHELLWAHYASEHRGFCLAYDLDLLVNSIYRTRHLLNMEYAEQPPNVKMNDLAQTKEGILQQKLFGTKSRSWEYEKEIRIVGDEIGENDYQHDALRAVYFGYRMDDQKKDTLMKSLQGRGLRYYQIYLEKDSYQFKAEEVVDKYADAKEYLFSEFRGIEYDITELKYEWINDKGIISIDLSNKVSEQVLSTVGQEIKNKIFRRAERVFMFYNLPEFSKLGSWATSHYERGKVTPRILGLSIEGHEQIVETMKTNQTEDCMGQWITSSGLQCGWDLSENGEGVFLTTYYKNGKSKREEVIRLEHSDGARYDTKEKDAHGEYMVVSEKGTLDFYSSSNEVFLKVDAV